MWVLVLANESNKIYFTELLSLKVYNIHLLSREKYVTCIYKTPEESCVIAWALQTNCPWVLRVSTQLLHFYIDLMSSNLSREIKLHKRNNCLGQTKTFPGYFLFIYFSSVLYVSEFTYCLFRNFFCPDSIRIHRFVCSFLFQNVILLNALLPPRAQVLSF